MSSMTLKDWFKHQAEQLGENTENLVFSSDPENKLDKDVNDFSVWLDPQDIICWTDNFVMSVSLVEDNKFHTAKLKRNPPTTS